MKVISLCDGIGTGHYILKKMAIEHQFFAVEIEPWKSQIALLNNPEHQILANDVVFLSENKNKFEWNYDLVLCGFTCSSLTSQGSRKDWEGDSKIFWNCVDILNHIKSINPDVKFLFENVSSMKNKPRDEISKALGVDYFKLDAGIVSEQARVRYYWFNWKKPDIEKLKIEYSKKSDDEKSFLDDDAVSFFAFTKSNRNKIGMDPIVQGRFREDGKAATLVTGNGCRGQSTMNQVITKKMRIRNLSLAECKRLQGIDDYIFSCSDSKAFKAIGEGWSVQAVSVILKELFKHGEF